jgi:hypothetical protein
MHHRQRLAAIAAGILMISGLTATAPAIAAPEVVKPQQAAPTATPLVVNARLGAHRTFDRIIIDVKGRLPSTTVHRVKELRYDGSGRKVPLKGRYFLEIKFSPAAAHNDAGRSVYRGPRLVKPSMPELKGFALTGDFEGVVTFGAAFDNRPHYTTMRLDHPERFVVDISHSRH